MSNEIAKQLIKMVDDAEAELVELLQGLVRIPSENTGAAESGHETDVAQFLQGYLEREGIGCEIIESAPGRGNLIAKLDAETTEAAQQSILLMSHLDVVPAGRTADWSHPPFAAVVDEGRLYGRGSADCKGLVASEAMALILLKRAKAPLQGNIILAAGADEEAGGKYGFGWLAEHAPEKLRASVAFNEGGGTAITGADGRLGFVFNTGEKGRYELHLLVKGSAGHAAWPWLSDNALGMAGRLLEAIRAYEPEINVEHPVFGQLPAFLGVTDIVTAANIDRFADALSGRQPHQAANLRAMSRLTLTPTMIDAGIKSNSIPDEVAITCDIRSLPHQDEAYILAQVDQVLVAAGLAPGGDVEVELITTAVPSSSELDPAVLARVRSALNLGLGRDAEDPGLTLIPGICTGFTDSRLVRPLGTPVFDFAPTSPNEDVGKLNVHGIDESISIESLLLSTRTIVAYLAQALL